MDRFIRIIGVVVCILLPLCATAQDSVAIRGFWGRYNKHPKMVARMYQGDPFYQSKIYDRVDLFIYLYRSSFVDFYFSYNFHFDDQKAFQEQQQLFVRFNLDGLMSRKEGYLRGLFDK